MPKPIDARKRDVNAKNAPDWSAPLVTVDVDVVDAPMSFQDKLDILAASGKPLTGPADASNPDATLDVDHPGLSDSDRGAAMREQRPLPKFNR